MRKKTLLLSFFGLVILLSGLVFGLFLTQTRQEIRKEATTTGGIGKLMLNPQTVTKYPGEIFSTTVKFHTGSALISTLTFRLTYPYTGATPELDIVDANGTPSNQVYPTTNLTSTGKWVFPIKSVSRTNNLITVDFAAIDTDPAGFSTPATSFTELANIYFKVNRASANPITLTFNTTQTKMNTKGEPIQDILDIPANASYTLTTDTVAPNSITDLAITNNGLQSLSLRWTSPIDTGPEGKATTYDLRYSTSPLTEANWASATTVTGEPIPGNPGTTQTFTVSGLLTSTNYYFAVKSVDVAGNTSALSNVASGKTTSPTISFGFKIQGLNKASVQKTIEVTLKNATTTKIYSGVFVSNSGGILSPVTPITLTDLPITTAGTAYDVYVKESSALKKKLGTITITPANALGPTTWNGMILKAGDFNNDNIINITDIGLFLSSYTALSVPVNANINKFDVNSNGFIEILDISLVLNNYTALTVPGD